MASTEQSVDVFFMGLAGQAVATLREDHDQTILAVRRRLSELIRVPPTRLILILEGVELSDEATLQNSGVAQNPEVYVIFKQPRQALTGSEDDLKLWDLDGGACLRTFEAKGVKALAVDWMSMQAVSGSEEGLAQLWDLNAGNCIQSFQGHAGAVTTVDVAWTDGQMLSGSLDARINLWDVEGGALVRSFGQGAGVRALVANWAAKQVLISRASLVQLWDVDTGSCLRTYPGHRAQVLAIAADWDGQRAVSSDIDCRVRKWCLVTGDCRQVLVLKPEARRRDGILAISVDWDNEVVLIGSQDGSLQLWDLRGAERIRNFEVPTVPIVPIQALTTDWAARQALSSGSDRQLRLWNVDTGQCVWTFEKGEVPAKAIAASWCK